MSRRINHYCPTLGILLLRLFGAAGNGILRHSFHRFLTSCFKIKMRLLLLAIGSFRPDRGNMLRILLENNFNRACRSMNYNKGIILVRFLPLSALVSLRPFQALFSNPIEPVSPKICGKLSCIRAGKINLIMLPSAR
jgi:hypothetical protein